MTGGADWLTVEGAIRRGDRAALSDIAARDPGFPAGAHPQAGPWIGLFARFGTPDLVRWALDRGAPADPEAPDGFPPLHAAIDAGGAGRAGILAALLGAGADPDRRGINDWTALHLAAARGDALSVRLLLDAGADAGARTRIDDHATPEDEARRAGHAALADLLRDSARDRTPQARR